MEEEKKEYVTFTVTDKEGKEVELAVVDAFTYKHKEYVAAARIEDDLVHEDALFIYKVDTKSEEFAVSKITSTIEYQEIAKAYLDMN